MRTPQPIATRVTKTGDLLHRLNGVFIMIGALAIGLIGWLALSFLADSLRKNAEMAKDIAPLARTCIENRGWLPVAATPALAAGFILLRRGGGRAAGWPLFILGYLWLFALLGLILYSFVCFLSPLYQYQPL